MDVNFFFGVGRLTAPVEYTPPDEARKISARAVGRLAINRPRNGKTGEREPDYIRFVTWGAQAEAMADHTGKGKELAIVGPIQTNTQRDAATGKNITYYEVRAMMVSFGRDSQATKLQRVSKELPSKQSEEAEAIRDALAMIGVDLPEGMQIDDAPPDINDNQVTTFDPFG